MGEPIILDFQKILDWAPKIDTDKQQVLNRLILTASDYIENDLSYIVRAPTTPITRFYDGDGMNIGGRFGHLLYLRERIADLSALTVTENATALTVVTGYTTSANVVVQNTGTMSPQGLLTKRTIRETAQGIAQVESRRNFLGGWVPGIQNIAVTFTPGWDLDQDDTDPIPQDLVHACVELTYFLFKRSGQMGVSSRSSRGGSTSFKGEIPEGVRDILDRRRRFVP